MIVRAFNSLCSAWNGLTHHSLSFRLRNRASSGIPFLCLNREYPTKKHRAAIAEQETTPYHRMTFNLLGGGQLELLSYNLCSNKSIRLDSRSMILVLALMSSRRSFRSYALSLLLLFLQLFSTSEFMALSMWLNRLKAEIPNIFAILSNLVSVKSVSPYSILQ